MIFTGVDHGGTGWCLESTARERFYAAFIKDDSTGCWNWLHALDKDGYGHLQVGKRHHGSHRVSYELHIGVIPEGLEICHKCDNPRCVNPDHLFAGTTKDNAEDRVRKGRSNPPKGEQCKGAKLTNEQVRFISHLKKSGAPVGEIASRFNVSVSCVYKVASGLRWAHVTTPTT